MKKYLASLMLVAAGLGLAGPAAAVVIPGSSYSIYIEGSASDNQFLGEAQFDNAPSSATRNGLLLTLSESETALNSTSSRITLDLSANGDLFPSPDDTAILAIGTDGNGLDFTTPVELTGAHVTLRNRVGDVLFASDDLSGLAANNSPWDGTFPAPSTAFGIDGIGDMGVSDITFDFTVAELPGGQVPEPDTILLCGLGLVGVFAAGRRRATKTAA